MEAPSPKPYPVVGHLPYLTGPKGKAQVEIFHDLLQEFDYDCVKLNIANRIFLVTANPDHVQQMVEDTGSFGKIVHDMKRGPIWAARQSAGKGLFTSSDTEDDWGIAHRILIPAFSMHGMKEAVPLAVDATLNTARFFESLGTSANFEMGGFMTGITFDVIGRFSCGLDFGTSNDPDIRYSHPFLQNMDTTLTTNQIIGKAPYKAKLPTAMMRSRKEAIRRQQEYVQKIIDDRRSGRQVAEQPDLLSRMLEQTDPETGRKMPDDMMAANLITFFAAGHDSTSSLLTTAMFYISQYPEVEGRLVAEINEVLPGEDDLPTYQDLKKLKYMTQVLKECLRLHPPAPGFLKRAIKDGKLGSYNLKDGTQVLTSLAALHTNPAVWGPNATKFDPEHFSPEAEAARHKYSWLPFSAGPRACIGMQLSLTEARVALAILWKKFTFRLHKSARVYGDYSKVFFKLRDVQMTVHPRVAASCVVPHAPAAAISPQAESLTSKPQQPSTSSDSNGPCVPSHGTSVNVYYGSNMGNCKGIAEQFAAAAKAHGFDPALAPLDQAIDELPALAAAEGLALIVTSTYNGTPPDNARKFSKWAETSPNLSGLQVGILGIGNSNWKTFQAFPRKVTADLTAASATVLVSHGEVDEEDDLESAVQQWSGAFWKLALAAAGQDASSAADVTMVTTSQSFAVTVTDCPPGTPATSHPANASACTGTVLRSYDLGNAEAAAKPTRHVEIQLPKGVTYSHGDHLAVMPMNSFDIVLRVAVRLGIDLDDIVLLGSAGGEELAHLPYNTAVNVRELLLRHVDLSAALSYAFLAMAAEHAGKPAEQAAILALADNESGSNDMRLAQLLESFSSLALSLPDVLALLPPMKQRYYSISSSPAGPCGPRVASITVGLVEGNSPVDNSHYQGMASGLLHNLKPGMPVDVFVASNDRFRLPAEPNAPIIMIGPGTGLAPFRGFLQELAATPREAPAALFFGCRSEAEYIYKTELEAAAMTGTLELMSVAYSRAGPEKVYVQHKLWESRATVWEMLKAGGYVYVCGDARYMAKDVDCTLVRIVQEVGGHSYESALAFVQGLTESDRYLQDVWAN